MFLDVMTQRLDSRARFRFGQVLLGRDVVNRPDDDLVGLGVGVDHLIIEHRFVEPEIGTLRDVAHVGAREPLLERFLERRNVARHRRRGGRRLRQRDRNRNGKAGDHADNAAAN